MQDAKDLLYLGITESILQCCFEVMNSGEIVGLLRVVDRRLGTMIMLFVCCQECSTGKCKDFLMKSPWAIQGQVDRSVVANAITYQGSLAVIHKKIGWLKN